MCYGHNFLHHSYRGCNAELKQTLVNISITNYLKTDPKLDDIKQEYEIKSKMIEENKNDDGNYQA